jgi:hypothetical protein
MIQSIKRFIKPFDKEICMNINIDTPELITPISAAVLMNTLRLEELIALQKGESFDQKKALESIITQWCDITLALFKKMTPGPTTKPQ